MLAGFSLFNRNKMTLGKISYDAVNKALKSEPHVKIIRPSALAFATFENLTDSEADDSSGNNPL